MGSEQQLMANSATHRVLISGNSSDPAVVLIHGFPSNSSLWERQVPALAKAGFRVITPDLRGAPGGGSQAPKDSEDCSITKVIVKDIAGIMDALDIQKAHIVGHDWGAATAWAFAGLYPDRTLDLIAISVGHPTGYMSGSHIGIQKQKSWYMLLFNYPGIGEQGLLTGSLGRGFTSPETAKVEAPMWQAHKTFENLGKEGAATAALSWYRANAKPECFNGDYGLFQAPPVTCRTMQIWPTGDEPFCCEEQAKSSGDWVKAPGTFRYERVESLSHFAVWTEPEPISKLILDFLGQAAKL